MYSIKMVSYKILQNSLENTYSKVLLNLNNVCNFIEKKFGTNLKTFIL